MEKPRVWFLVPARGGSKGIPRKNLRPLAGRPLLRHVLDTLSTIAAKEQVIVSTDDAEIGEVAASTARVVMRPQALATDAATLDAVALHVAQVLADEGARPDEILVTVQPTSPFVSQQSLQSAIDALAGGAGCAITVKDDRHLRWTRDAAGQARPLFDHRLNRQWLPPTLAETGGAIAVRLGDLLKVGTRIVGPVALVEISQREGLDIDSYADWAVAEHLARRLRVVLRADGAPGLGLGHVYRALALAHAFAGHEILLATAGGDSFGAQVLRRQHFPLEVLVDGSDGEFFGLAQRVRPHIVVIDLLDSRRELVAGLKAEGAFVVTFEDHGPGAMVADLVVNDIYSEPGTDSPRHLVGLPNTILAPWFETVSPRSRPEGPVQNVLVSFGGTDPARLTTKTVDALARLRFEGQVTVVLGPGYGGPTPDLAALGLRGAVLRSVPNMALVMREADLAITSAGRTVAEVLQMGVPCLVLCQNMRELTHTHATMAQGVLNLGLGANVPVEAITEHIRTLMGDLAFRQAMHDRALVATAGRSNAAVADRILERYWGRTA